MKCSNCRNDIPVKEVKKHMTINCNECNCIMKCLDVNEYISRWRVMNPFNIEDRRKSK